MLSGCIVGVCFAQDTICMKYEKVRMIRFSFQIHIDRKVPTAEVPTLLQLSVLFTGKEGLEVYYTVCFYNIKPIINKISIFVTIHGEISL